MLDGTSRGTGAADGGKGPPRRVDQDEPRAAVLHLVRSVVVSHCTGSQERGDEEFL